MRIRYIAFMALLATTLLNPPTASACSLNPTAIISAPGASSSHIHGTAVGFNGSTSTANCGTIIGYLWKNGNTTLSTSPTFNYTVTLAPEQVDSVITVSLKVTSSHNARTHTVYRTITIKRDHQSQYFVKDHLGSPRVVVDGKGAVLSYTDYYPFGMVMPGRAGNISLSNDRVKFTGYLLEEEGEQDTYHAEARGYDPVIGRFTSRDPLTGKMPGWNPYHYSFNNPNSYVDPSGLIPWPIRKIWVTPSGTTVTRRVDSPFGPRSSRYHYGVDMNLGSGRQDMGVPIYATHDGIVRMNRDKSDNDGAGNRVHIESEDGTLKTVYMHMVSPSSLSEGANVKEGDVIGFIGGTAFGQDNKVDANGKRIAGTDVHLHYELHQKNDKGDLVPINPLNDDGTLKDPQKMLGLPSNVRLPEDLRDNKTNKEAKN